LEDVSDQIIRSRPLMHVCTGILAIVQGRLSLLCKAYNPVSSVLAASTLLVLGSHHVRFHPPQVMFVTQSFGLLLGTIVMVPKTAQTIASVVMLTFVLTGGYFVTSIPAWIGWLSESLDFSDPVCLCCIAGRPSVRTCQCSHHETFVACCARFLSIISCCVLQSTSVSSSMVRIARHLHGLAIEMRLLVYCCLPCLHELLLIVLPAMLQPTEPKEQHLARLCCRLWAVVAH
jgi:hypothetical protein